MKQRICRLSGERSLAWSDSGTGAPLILLHGWAASKLVFTELASLLNNEFRVLCPDLPGHGHSSAGQDMTLDGLCNELMLWFDELGERPFLLAGWSLGGMLALELASRDQQICSGLVLIGTTPRFVQAEDWPDGLPSIQLRAMQRNLSRKFDQTLADFFDTTFAGEQISRARLQEIRRFAIYPSRTPDPKTAATMLELLAGQDQRHLVKRIAQPTTLIHGRLDQITPPGAANWLWHELPQAHLEMIDHCGHAPFWSQPKHVAALVREAARWSR